MSATRSRRIELARGGWGLAMLLAPRQVMHRMGVGVDARSVVIGRILGARQLTQAVLSGIRPSPEVLAMGVWVDAVHAVTAVGLAAADRDRMRAGLLDAAIAAGWSGGGYRDLTHAQATPLNHQHLRNRLARIVLGVAPGGRPLLSRANADRRRDGSTR